MMGDFRNPLKKSKITLSLLTHLKLRVAVNFFLKPSTELVDNFHH